MFNEAVYGQAVPGAHQQHLVQPQLAPGAAPPPLHKAERPAGQTGGALAPPAVPLQPGQEVPQVGAQGGCCLVGLLSGLRFGYPCLHSSFFEHGSVNC